MRVEGGQRNLITIVCFNFLIKVKGDGEGEIAAESFSDIFILNFASHQEMTACDGSGRNDDGFIYFYLLKGSVSGTQNYLVRRSAFPRTYKPHSRHVGCKTHTS